MAALSAHRSAAGYRGVYWDPDHRKFRAEIGAATSEQPRHRLGRFSTAEKAAEAYDAAAEKRYGSAASFNFPRPGERKTKYGGGCVHGDSNIYVAPNGQRNCRVCNAAAAARRKARMKAAGTWVPSGGRRK
jgi:hypothetical protein